MPTHESSSPAATITQAFANQTVYFRCASVNQNGWLPYEQLRLPVDDLGFRQGVTAVERLRTYGGQPFLIEKHLARFENTLRLIQIDGAGSVDQWRGWIVEILARNASLIDAHGGVGITLWATPGHRSDGPPSIAVHLNPIDHAAVRRRRTAGQTVMLTRVVQPDVGCWSRHAKVRSRLHYFLADQAAREFSATGVLGDIDGSWTESSAASLGVVAGGVLTFAPSDRVLPGITQGHVRESAQAMGIVVCEAPISTELIIAAETVLLMGTDTGLWFADRVVDAAGKRLCSYDSPHDHRVYQQLRSAMPVN